MDWEDASRLLQQMLKRSEMHRSERRYRVVGVNDDEAGAVLFFNDLALDDRYAQWPDGVESVRSIIVHISHLVARG